MGHAKVNLVPEVLSALATEVRIVGLDMPVPAFDARSTENREPRGGVTDFPSEEVVLEVEKHLLKGVPRIEGAATRPDDGSENVLAKLARGGGYELAV
jgi:hypothetical protein